MSFNEVNLGDLAKVGVRVRVSFPAPNLKSPSRKIRAFFLLFKLNSH